MKRYFTRLEAAPPSRYYHAMLTPSESTPATRPTLAVSACLLGEAVRYDGGHKRHHYISDELSRFCTLRPLCPEVAIGLGTPRPSIQLIGSAAAPRAVEVRDHAIEVTDRLADYGLEIATTLRGQIAGYLFKKDSPSCGMERVRVYQGAGRPPERKGVGIYSRAIQQQLPLLPVEEEGRLADGGLRENFISRLFTLHRWQSLPRPLTAATLLQFHAQHKYLLMAHSPAAYRRIGQRLSHLRAQPLEVISAHYIADLMQSLKEKATRARHANVLHHLLGYLKNHLNSADKAELLELIDRYRHGDLAHLVPLMLLRHHFRHHPDRYIAEQYYLNPYPDALREIELR